MSHHHLHLNARRWAQVRWRVFERKGWRQRVQHKRSTWPGLFSGLGSTGHAQEFYGETKAVDVNLKVPAIEKLLDYAASGIGSVAGPMLAPWRARSETPAKLIVAEGDAEVLAIQAEAQSKAREILLSQDTDVTGELDITNKVKQRLLFQEQKRQYNIETVVRKAASHLGDKGVSKHGRRRHGRCQGGGIVRAD